LCFDGGNFILKGFFDSSFDAHKERKIWHTENCDITPR
jgi:hypothetical protein